MITVQKKDVILKELFDIDSDYREQNLLNFKLSILEKYPKKINLREINDFLDIIAEDGTFDFAYGITIKGKMFHIEGGYSNQARSSKKKEEPNWYFRTIVGAIVVSSLYFAERYFESKLFNNSNIDTTPLQIFPVVIQIIKKIF